MFDSGEALFLIFHDDDTPRVTSVKVEKTEPLTVVLPNSISRDALQVGSSVSMIYRSPVDGHYSDATVSEITKYGMNWVVELSGMEWSRIERRRAPRVPVHLNAELTVIHESGLTPEPIDDPCEVTAISFYGCRTTTKASVEPGSLLAVTIHTGLAEGLCLLGIVTRKVRDPDGLAIEFFDYRGSTRFQLNSYLNTLPKAA